MWREGGAKVEGSFGGADHHHNQACYYEKDPKSISHSSLSTVEDMVCHKVGTINLTGSVSLISLAHKS